MALYNTFYMNISAHLGLINPSKHIVCRIILGLEDRVEIALFKGDMGV